MPTNEAGLSEGHDMGDGGGTTASDMPGGEENDAPDGRSSTQKEPGRADDQASTGDGDGI